ncbi:response regulator transcription factor [Actinomadura bangladeshensis]|uniref:Response regulator transcription factor n=1 Tax=Actinomadura bangladeshensis TaxID=453573 RepID=A0A4V2XNY3_9ACTN|nr:response regulator transcription factor [Actinomadura bangladeshensis]
MSETACRPIPRVQQPSSEAGGRRIPGAGLTPRTVLIVDGHTLVRQGVREILEEDDGLKVVGEAGDGEEAVAVAADQRPDVVLLEVGGHGRDAVTTVRRIRRHSPDTKVIILSMQEGPELLRALLEAGIRGYLLKTVTRHELVAAIQAVQDPDRIVLSVSRRSLPEDDGAQPVQLTERERQVLELTAQALTNRQIGNRLSLTEATVKRHLRNIFAKLGAGSRLDAVNRAALAGLIEPPRNAL